MLTGQSFLLEKNLNVEVLEHLQGEGFGTLLGLQHMLVQMELYYCCQSEDQTGSRSDLQSDGCSSSGVCCTLSGGRRDGKVDKVALRAVMNRFITLVSALCRVHCVVYTVGFLHLDVFPFF